MKSMVCLTYVGLSGLQVVLGGVRKIGQQWWGLNASVNFVNDREESDEEEEEDIEDEPNDDLDVASEDRKSVV